MAGKAHATLINEVEAELQDSGNAVYSAAELATQLDKGLNLASEYVPYIMEEVFRIESRTGTATSTTANTLVDSQGQFLSTDVNKEVYNTTDKTRAIVIAYVDANNLTLSKDIMASGEGYEMYNKKCRTSKQVYIGDVTDYLTIERVEYPIDTPRSWDLHGNILSILKDTAMPDSADSNSDIEVFVWFRKIHRVSQLTTLTGEIDLPAGYAAGLSAIHIDGLQASGTFAQDTLFTIEKCRGTYRATADATIANSECDLAIFPPLEDAVVDGEDIAIIGTTLDRSLERLAVSLTAAEAMISKGAALLSEGNNAIATLATINTTIGNMTARITQAVTDIASARTAVDLAPAIILEANTAIDSMSARITQALADIASGRTEVGLSPLIVVEANTAINAMSARITQAIADISSGRTEVAKTVALIDTANTALTKVDTEVTKALFDLDAGRNLINTVSIGGDVSQTYAQYGSHNIQNARAYLEEAIGYMKQAAADESVGGSYGALAARELSAAVNSLQQAGGYFRQAGEDNSIANTYGGLAARELASASEHLTQATGFLNQVRADESVAGTYGGVGARELTTANSYLAQSGAYIQRISAGLRVAQSAKLYRDEGERRLALVLRELRSKAKMPVYESHSRG